MSFEFATRNYLYPLGSTQATLLAGECPHQTPSLQFVSACRLYFKGKIIIISRDFQWPLGI